MFPYRKILCPIDLSELSYEALDTASELAARFGAELCVLHIVTPRAPELAVADYNRESFVRENMDAARKKLRALIAERVPSTVETRRILEYGAVANEIKHTIEGENADLMVIATHGLTGWRHLLYGSVAERVLRTTHFPLLVVHAPHHAQS